MRKLFFILLLSCLVAVIQGAAIKIALIGDSPEANKVADLALVELSKDSAIEFLERKEINRITAEHKLSAWSQGANEIIRLGKLLNVDLFAVLRSENKQYFFVVFDAKSAVRLTDRQLNGNSIDTLATDMTETLKQAIPKLQKENSLRKITLFSIRNVELPRSKDRTCSRIAAELVRKIGQLPNFAVIEGRYIGLINKERELTQVASSLSQASFLLNVDFYQSELADKTLVKLEIKIPGGKSKHFTMNCNLKTLQTPPVKLTEIIAYMRREKQKTNISPKAEAARYYYEFEELFKKREFIKCLPKIEAAIAYNNSNNIYQEALLKAISSCAMQEYRSKIRSIHKCTEEEINRYLDHLERWRRLEPRFKSSPNYVPSFRRNFSMYFAPLIYSTGGFYRTRGIYKTMPSFSETTNQRIESAYHIYEDYKKRKYNFTHWMDPNVKLSSKRDMLYFDIDFQFLISSAYLTQNKKFSNVTTLIKLYLKKTEHASEGICGKNTNGHIVSWRSWNTFFVCFNSISANSKQLAELEKIAKIATKHPWPFVKLYGTFALYLIETKKNPKRNEKSLNTFLKRMNSIFQDIPHRQNSVSLINLYIVARLIGSKSLIWVRIADVANFRAQTQAGLFSIMKQRTELYTPFIASIASRVRNQQTYDLVKKTAEYINSGKWQMIGSNINTAIIKSVKEKINRQLAEYQPRSQQSSKYKNRKQRLLEYRNRKRRFAESRKKKESTNNSPFTVKKLLAFKNRVLIAISSHTKQYIYWASLQYEKDRKYAVNILSYDTLSKKSSSIGKKISLPYRPSISSIALGEDYLAIAMYRRAKLNMLIVYNIKTGKTTELTLPFEWPGSIAIVNKRLLVWCRMDNMLLEYQLPSMKYKVVYSAKRRRNPSDPFNNQTVRFNIMFADQKRQRAVIMLSGYNLVRPGWWYYYPAKEKFEYIGIYPRPQGQKWNKLTEDKVLLASRNVSFLLDLKNNTKELLFFAISGDKDRERKKTDFERYAGGKARVILNNSSTLSTPAANTIAGNYYWTNSPWFRLDLSSGKKTFYSTSSELNSPALILQTINNKTLLFVNLRGIFKLHLKEDKSTARNK